MECILWDQTGRLPVLFLREGGREGGVRRVVGWREGRLGLDPERQLTRLEDEGVVGADDGIEKIEDAVAGLPWYVFPSLPPSFPPFLHLSLTLPPSLTCS